MGIFGFGGEKPKTEKTLDVPRLPADYDPVAEAYLKELKEKKKMEEKKLDITSEPPEKPRDRFRLLKMNSAQRHAWGDAV